MSDRRPLMPKATAVWLVENTSLSFEQIAAFCGMHLLEVKGIADGDVAQGIKGMDPISSGQLAREEIEKAEQNPGYLLKLAEAKVEMPAVKSKRGPRYTPVSRRGERPGGIARRAARAERGRVQGRRQGASWARLPHRAACHQQRLPE